ncbi:LemA family protein [Candidatus Peregrinibacteria bacterium]|nr:LemA family protein [Candidatus Peregrinibacteria bacterium]MBT4632363.1 LemA family protein [Candidatus Peregrinibacteria bacterium]MBT5516320.1 LemA family protein [Candidatus Peregrinibacteria bacterium]
MAKSRLKVPVWFIIIALLIALAGWLGGQYNSLIRLDAEVELGWSEVQTQYQRRSDLIPQLIATVQGSADFESSVLMGVTEARTNWLGSQNDTSTITEQMEASSSFDSAISRLLVTVENYPDLKSSENFLSLQAQLEGTENRVSVSRDDYNADVTDYNKSVRQVPTNIVAAMFSFNEHILFESEEGSEIAPEVEFDFSR